MTRMLLQRLFATLISALLVSVTTAALEYFSYSHSQKNIYKNIYHEDFISLFIFYFIISGFFYLFAAIPISFIVDSRIKSFIYQIVTYALAGGLISFIALFGYIILFGDGIKPRNNVAFISIFGIGAAILFLIVKATVEFLGRDK